MSNREFYNSGPQGHYNNGDAQPMNNDGPKDKGLLATVGGGAAGAYGGNKLFKNHGTLGAIGGAVVGAIAANKMEDKYEQHKYNQGYQGHNNGPFGHHGHHNGSFGHHGHHNGPFGHHGQNFGGPQYQGQYMNQPPPPPGPYGPGGRW